MWCQTTTWQHDMSSEVIDYRCCVMEVFADVCGLLTVIFAIVNALMKDINLSCVHLWFVYVAWHKEWWTPRGSREAFQLSMQILTFTRGLILLYSIIRQETDRLSLFRVYVFLGFSMPGWHRVFRHLGKTHTHTNTCSHKERRKSEDFR